MSRKKPAGQGFPSANEIRGNALPDVIGQEDARTDLALDISSSCVGWAAGVDGQLIGFGKFVFKTTAEVGEKLFAWYKFFRVLLATYQPDLLLIERPLKARGNTTARHFEMLGVTKFMWREHSGREIDKKHSLAPKTIKSWLNVRRGSSHKENKEIMVNKINSLCQLSLRYDRNTTSSYKNDDDPADAIAVLIAFWRKFGFGDE